eukprot:scaffold1237_cov243-Pinguiococcus_pyrenoidosus.AAC.2
MSVEPPPKRQRNELRHALSGLHDDRMVLSDGEAGRSDGPSTFQAAPNDSPRTLSEASTSREFQTEPVRAAATYSTLSEQLGAIQAEVVGLEEKLKVKEEELQAAMDKEDDDGEAERAALLAQEKVAIHWRLKAKKKAQEWLADSSNGQRRFEALNSMTSCCQSFFDAVKDHLEGAATPANKKEFCEAIQSAAQSVCDEGSRRTERRDISCVDVGTTRPTTSTSVTLLSSDSPSFQSINSRHKIQHREEEPTFNAKLELPENGPHLRLAVEVLWEDFCEDEICSQALRYLQSTYDLVFVLVGAACAAGDREASLRKVLSSLPTVRVHVVSGATGPPAEEDEPVRHGASQESEEKDTEVSEEEDDEAANDEEAMDSEQGLAFPSVSFDPAADDTSASNRSIPEAERARLRRVHEEFAEVSVRAAEDDADLPRFFHDFKYGADQEQNASEGGPDSYTKEYRYAYFEKEKFVRRLTSVFHDATDPRKPGMIPTTTILAGGATQIGKTMFKCLGILCANHYNIATVVLTPTEPGRRELTQKIGRFLAKFRGKNYLPVALMSGRDEYDTSTEELAKSTFKGKKASERRRQILSTGGCIVINGSSFKQIDKVYADLKTIQSKQNCEGRARLKRDEHLQFALFVDEADELEREAGPQYVNSLRRLKGLEHACKENGPLELDDFEFRNPTVILSISATLFPLLAEIEREDPYSKLGADDLFFSVAPPGEYVGVNHFRPLQDNDGNEIYLEDGELTPHNLYTGEGPVPGDTKVAKLFQHAQNMASTGRQALVLDITCRSVFSSKGKGKTAESGRARDRV